MRHYVYLILFLIVLAAPFVLRAVVKTAGPPAPAGEVARLVIDSFQYYGAPARNPP